MKAYSGADLIVQVVVSEIFVNCPAIYTVTKKYELTLCAETRLRDAVRAIEAYRCYRMCCHPGIRAKPRTRVVLSRTRTTPLK